MTQTITITSKQELSRVTRGILKPLIPGEDYHTSPADNGCIAVHIHTER